MNKIFSLFKRRPIRVVINSNIGGFGLSEDAFTWLENNGMPSPRNIWEMPRHHPLLIKCVEDLGEAVNSIYSKIQIVTIEGNRYKIVNWNGNEKVITPENENWIVVD
jgi:hypothetical protein